jgi:hypothetical protein
MAGRKDKNTVDYFPHYCNSGKTMFILENKYGNDGYATWFKILEMLGSSENHYIDCRNISDWEFIQAKVRVSSEVLSDILYTLANLDAINKELWDNKVIWSSNFIENISDAYLRRNNKCMQFDDLCKHLSIKCKQKCKSSDNKADINTQTKVYNTILDETKEEVIDTLLFSDNEANDLNENSTVSTVVTVTETPQSTVVTEAEMPQSKVDKNILDKTKEKTTCLSFEEFWDLYDKKVELKKCKSKYEKVSEKDRKKIKETLPLYLKTITDKQYQKNPSTYLNNQCWNDEIIEKPSAYKKKEEQEKPSVAPAKDYHRFIDLIRSNPILNESRNMLQEFEYNNLKMSYEEIVSLLPKIASMERRRGLYLELIDERDRIAYYKNKLNK